MIVFNYEVEYRFYKVLEQFFYYLSLYVEGLVIFCVNILFYLIYYSRNLSAFLFNTILFTSSITYLKSTNCYQSYSFLIPLVVVPLVSQKRSVKSSENYGELNQFSIN